MIEKDWLVQKFEENRGHLRVVAYRMLGSLNEADDAVQEAWLRLSRSDAASIDNLSGWLTTVTARVCLDMLRSRKSRREESLDAGMPELVLSRADQMDPEHETLFADSVSLALLVVLQTLSPQERLAFVLHDTFAVPFEEIAAIVGCSPEAARQLASRARRRIRGTTAVPDVDRSQQRKVVDAFITAVRTGSLEALLEVLDPGVVLRSDYATPAARVLHGARAVAESAITFSRIALTAQPVLVNGVAGIVSWLPDGQPFSIMAFTVRNARIAEIDVITDRARLARLDLSVLKRPSAAS